MTHRCKDRFKQRILDKPYGAEAFPRARIELLTKLRHPLLRIAEKRGQRHSLHSSLLFHKMCKSLKLRRPFLNLIRIRPLYETLELKDCN